MIKNMFLEINFKKPSFPCYSAKLIIKKVIPLLN